MNSPKRIDLAGATIILVAQHRRIDTDVGPPLLGFGLKPPHAVSTGWPSSPIAVDCNRGCPGHLKGDEVMSEDGAKRQPLHLTIPDPDEETLRSEEHTSELQS